MTVKELRTLVDNLEEYIRIPGGIDRLRKTIIHLAISGQLVPRNESEGNAEELYLQFTSLRVNNKKSKETLLIKDEELPFDIPPTWMWVRLGSCAKEISYGYTASSHKENVGPKMVRITDIQNGSINWSTVPYCNISTKEKGKYLLHDGDILFARTGGTVGKSYLCEDPPESVFASYLIRVVTFPQLVPRFLLYYFESNTYWQQIYSDLSGTGQPNFNGTKLSNLLLPLPPAGEQERIVNKVGEVFELIDKLENAYHSEGVVRSQLTASSLADLCNGNDLALNIFSEVVKTEEDIERLEKAILTLALRGKLVPQMPQEGTGHELYNQIRDEHEHENKKHILLPPIANDEIPSGLPRTWAWVRLEELCWLDQGQKIENKEMNILDAKYLRGKKEPDKKKSGFKINSGQRAILVDGENSGEVFVVSESGYLGSTFKLLSMVKHVESKYLDIILANLKEEMRQNKVGIAIPHLDKKLFKEKVTPLPPLAEQRRIIEKVDQLLMLTRKLKQQVRNS